MLPAVLLAVGAVALYLGSRWLVDGAAGLALHYGVRPLIVGLTVVSIGTSSPEAVLAVVSTLEGANEISLGNVIGANISNGALVLGVACLLGPVALRLRSLRRESVFLLLSGPLVAVLALDGRLGLVDGMVLLITLVVFFYVLYTSACRGEECAVVEEELETVEGIKPRPVPMIALLLIAGTVLLALGAESVVDGASGLARGLGVSEEVIGLTLVGIGTTIPEITVTITGSRRGQSDVVLGNIIGTIIANSLFILGLGAVVGGYDTTGLETAVGLAVMIAMSTIIVVLLAAFDRGGRRMGAALLSAYAGYILLLVMLFG